jgi:hypothetical protein
MQNNLHQDASLLMMALHDEHDPPDDPDSLQDQIALIAKEIVYTSKPRLGHVEVMPNLFIGAWADACVHQNNFANVTVAETPYRSQHYFPMTDPGKLASDYINFELAANKTISLLQQGAPVLVHCWSGINRSTAICMAVLMVTKGMTLVQAYKHMKSIRSFIHPFPGQLKNILTFAGVSVDTLDTRLLPDYDKEWETIPEGNIG